MHKGPNVSTFPSALACLLSVAILVGVEGGSWLGLHSPSEKGHTASFHVLIGHLCIFSREMFIQILGSFLIGLSFYG